MGFKHWLLLRKLLTASRQFAKKSLGENSKVENVGRVQQKILTLLDGFQRQLKTMTNPPAIKEILLPVTLFLDEWLLKHYFQHRPQDWPLLQSQLFQVEHGGALFYETLDQYFKQDQPPYYVLEVYYFCLKSGFSGMYFNAPEQRDYYLKTLA